MAAELSVVSSAARNNAEWCDALCRTHGIACRFDADCWVSPERTPPLYPDAVTLTAGVAPAALLSRIDAGDGCSVKDSFADLDLTTDGFRVLFRGEWLLLEDEIAPGVPAGWAPVGSPRELEDWESAWGESTPALRLFRPELLANGAVAMLARLDKGVVTAGAVASRSETVIGLGNVFEANGDLASAWRDAATAAQGVWGCLPVVGYQSGAGLGAAHEAGFRSIGAMAVWLRSWV